MMNMNYNKLRNLSLIPAIGFGMGTSYLTLISVVNPISNSVTAITIGLLILFTILTTLIRYLTLPVMFEKHTDKTDEITILCGVLWFLNMGCFAILTVPSSSWLPIIGIFYLTALFVPVESINFRFWRKLNDR
ncbi:hypothetical protein Q6U52_000856 [Vibrio alginolyticus]|nr:hypothetical protein [Vibrio alginolyticus]